MQERATVGVTLSMSMGGIGKNISDTLNIVGPGDILGIDKKLVVRREPEEGVFNFEANYLPAIEFFEEDFPWRYTPATPAAGHRLRPWLALVVLKDGEFTVGQPKVNGFPSVLTIMQDLYKVLHPHEEHWAWAHVQVNKPNAGGGGSNPPMFTYINNLRADLEKDLNVAFSRLLCSRKLEPGTSYTAFLIPAFETGRLAGLNQPTTIIPSLKPSWDLGQSTSPREFPIYTQWRFGTAVDGDFETMVRALQPRAVDSSMGGTTVDISHSGMGLDTVFLSGASSQVLQTTVEMEAALCPPGFAPLPAQNTLPDVYLPILNQTVEVPGSLDNSTNPLKDYTKELKRLLNLSSKIKSAQVTPESHPFIPGKYIVLQSSSNTLPEEDPVVLPPLYGQWHADQKAVEENSPYWFQEVNLDVRYRIAAGLGARVVRENQNNFLEVAWKQVGEILEVNDRINKAIAAREVSAAVYQKHLIGDLNVTGANNVGLTDAEKMETLLKVATPSLKNITLNNSGAANDIIPRIALKSDLSETITRSSFRKAARNKSTYTRKIEAANPTVDSVTTGLIVKANVGVVSGAGPLGQPADVAVASQLLGDTAEVKSIRSYNQWSGKAPISSGTYSPWIDIYNNSFENLNKTVVSYQTRQDKYQIQSSTSLPPVQIAKDVASSIQISLNPANTIRDKTWAAIQLQYDGITQSTNGAALKPLMAYPILDEPMYNYLKQISTTYILPHVDKYPNNIVTALVPNNKFIEAYMLGLNHEFAKELLWQEYPTDQRGSYFRQFWDVNDTPNLDALQDPEYMYDIKRVDLWSGALGDNKNAPRLGGSSTGGNEYLVLLVRGDLLKKFPNTLIYMQKAVGSKPVGPNDPPRALSGYQINGTLNLNALKFPVFKSYVEPDIALVGFQISKAEALGTAPSDPAGWFFVFQERPGQVRFGLDEEPAPATPLQNWSNLNWAHMRSADAPNGTFDAAGTAYVARMNFAHNLDPTHVASQIDSQITALNSSITNNASLPWNKKIRWGENAAENATILAQQPVKMAVHADDLIA